MVSHFEHPRMLVDPIIPWGGIFLLHGPRAAGKSQLALQLASAIASGGLFLGTWRCTPARVLFVEVDMTEPILHERLRRMNGGLPPATKNLALLTLDSGFLNIEDPQNIRDPGIVDAKRYDPEVIFVDSLRKSHTRDENDSATPEIVYQAWRRHFPSVTLGPLHHNRKVIFGPNAGDRDEAFRGTTAWLDNADTGIQLLRDKHARDD